MPVRTTAGLDRNNGANYQREGFPRFARHADWCDQSQRGRGQLDSELLMSAGYLEKGGPRMKRLALVFLAFVLVSCASLESILDGYLDQYANKNLHVVDHGKLFRSAQLTGEELEALINSVKIRTVINLRGARSPGNRWYDEEKRVTTELGVTLIDIKMGASRLPHRPDLITLLDAFRDAERPILVHCRGGADRTGEAVAIYAMEYMGYSQGRALHFLSPRYFHLPERHPAKRYFVRLYQGEQWARETYDPCIQDYLYYDKGAYCVARALRLEPSEPDDWDDS